MQGSRSWFSSRKAHLFCRLHSRGSSSSRLYKTSDESEDLSQVRVCDWLNCGPEGRRGRAGESVGLLSSGVEEKKSRAGENAGLVE
jgi:hypothetical protein